MMYLINWYLLRLVLRTCMLRKKAITWKSKTLVSHSQSVLDSSNKQKVSNKHVGCSLRCTVVAKVAYRAYCTLKSLTVFSTFNLHLQYKRCPECAVSPRASLHGSFWRSRVCIHGSQTAFNKRTTFIISDTQTHKRNTYKHVKHCKCYW